MRECKTCQSEFNPKISKQIYCSRKCSPENRTKFNLVCEICKSDFTSRFKTTRFCSRKCSAEPKKTNFINTCQYCKKDFQTKRENALFCGNDCRGKSLIKTRRTISCQVCEKDFIPRKKTSIYCSNKCSASIRIKLTTVICAYCNKTFKPQTHKQKCCSFTCAGKNRAIWRDCKVCGKEFRVKREREDSNFYCSNKCSHSTRFLRPIVKCVNCSKEYKQRLNGEKLSKYCSKKCFKEVAGYGTVLTTKSGHTVQSGYEKLVANWFFDYKISYEYEPKLHIGKYKADFLVNDIYIEIWGLVGMPRYENSKRNKLNIYKKHNLNLIELFPQDFKNLVWKKKLEKHFSHI